MKHFFDVLQFRDAPLFIFGCCNMLAAFTFLLLARFTNNRVRGANAWFKPFKFALSIAVFSWTMGWYAYELNEPGPVNLYNWITIVLLGFEVVYITLQAGRGLTSHYNSSSPVYAFLAAMMGIAAAVATLWTGYIGILFFNADLPNLPGYYVLSIRIGILLFVFFAFQGASMGVKTNAYRWRAGRRPGITYAKLEYQVWRPSYCPFYRDARLAGTAAIVMVRFKECHSYCNFRVFICVAGRFYLGTGIKRQAVDHKYEGGVCPSIKTRSHIEPKIVGFPSKVSIRKRPFNGMVRLLVKGNVKALCYYYNKYLKAGKLMYTGKCDL